MFKYTVIEYEKTTTSSILLTGRLDHAPVAIHKCWNILWSAPYDTENEQDTLDAFKACIVWLEQNKVQGSKYVITEMFFYE